MNQLFSARNICFIGAGSMAEAIIRGLINGQVIAPDRIFAVNRSDSGRLQALSASYGIQVPKNDHNRSDMISRSDIIVLGMKPRDAAQAIETYAHLFREGTLIISIIAGLPVASLERLIGKPLPIARTMPNTSSTIGLGATGISYSTLVNEEHQQIVRTIFGSIGIVQEVEEHLLDAVTGVSGSGPAYIYYVMEAMIQGGIECGLTPEAATELTVQTVLGAASMVKQTGEPPAELRRKVTSPGGTTQAAIEYLASRQMQETVTHAVKRAAERAKELGSMFDS